MSVLINPGSHIGGEPVGWTNTIEGARRRAGEWLDRMRSAGFVDIEMVELGDEVDGRWLFMFRHTITGVEVKLETHGIDDLDAYMRQYIFDPRVYWNGSSSAEPQLDDFAAHGFSKTMTFTAVTE